MRGSFDNPIEHAENNNIITINLLQACRVLKFNPLLIICSTSEVYGNVKKKNMPITENNYISPINPYAVTKVYQDLISEVYRDSFNMKIIITRSFYYVRRINLFQTAFARQIALFEKGKIKILKYEISKYENIYRHRRCYGSLLDCSKGKIGETII